MNAVASALRLPIRILDSIRPHQGEPGDADLLEWIKDLIDSVVGVGPAVIVVALGLVILAIPVAIMVIFWAQRARQRRPQ